MSAILNADLQFPDQTHLQSHSCHRYECSLCEQIFAHLNDLDVHIYDHADDEPPFECPDCAELFKELPAYIEHMNAVHSEVREQEPVVTDIQAEQDFSGDIGLEPPETQSEIDELAINHSHRRRPPVSVAWQQRDNKSRPFACDQCERRFTLAASLSLHKRIHRGIRPFKCNICSWCFSQSSDLKKHMHKHTGEKPYECDICHVKFSQKRNLRNHMKMHTEAPSRCKYCEREFRLDTSLQQHLKKHEGEAVRMCDMCLMPFSSEHYLALHKRQVHGSEQRPKRLFACDSCGREFRKPFALKKHQLVHTGERPYSCDTCGKTFSHGTSLRNHHLVHTGERSFQCSLCGRAFAFSGNLIEHMRTHTGEKPFACDVCSKRFARSANLREHQKIHRGERAFECSVCAKAFTNSSTHAKHQKIHTGEKPHKCKLCPKAFIQLAHLTKHHRVHTGEKPYECPQCTKPFRRKDTLGKHLLTHRKVAVRRKEPEESAESGFLSSGVRPWSTQYANRK